MEILELLKALLIGIVQGITEWLPVSSTGHMIIVDDFVSLNVSPEFWNMFLSVIQFGSIMAVIILYFHRLNPFSRRKTSPQRRSTLKLWAKVIVACLPAAIIGIPFNDWFEEVFFNPVTVAIALVVYGIAFIVIERMKSHSGLPFIGALPFLSRQPRVKGAHVRIDPVDESRASRSSRLSRSGIGKPDVVTSVDDLGFIRALCVGLFQCLAMIPGTSRSGSSILGGRILGVSREAAAEFSFFLAIPVMFGWSLLKLVKTFVIDSIVLTATEWGVFVVGIVVAFLVSIAAIKFLMNFIKNHSFEVFGWYRIALGLVVLAFFFFTGQLVA